MNYWLVYIDYVRIRGKDWYLLNLFTGIYFIRNRDENKKLTGKIPPIVSMFAFSILFTDQGSEFTESCGLVISYIHDIFH